MPDVEEEREYFLGNSREGLCLFSAERGKGIKQGLCFLRQGVRHGCVPAEHRKEQQFRFPRVCLRAISLYLPWKGVGGKHHLLRCVPAELRARARREDQVELAACVSGVMLLWEKRITLPERQRMPAGYVA